MDRPRVSRIGELIVHIGGKAYPLPVGAAPGAKTGGSGTSPATAGGGKAAAQKPVKKSARPKTPAATNSTGRKKLAG